MIDKGFEQFGAAVRRTQDTVERLRGRARNGGVSIEVDAGNRITAIELDPRTVRVDADRLADLIHNTYAAAVADLQPRLRQALAEVTDDPRVAGLNRWIAAQGHGTAGLPPAPSGADSHEPSYLELRGGTIFER